MGAILVSPLTDYLNPDSTPNFKKPPIHDPLTGFENGRQEREMKATEVQMINANLQPRFRDYCAHLMIDLNKCRNDQFPCTYKCKAVLHAWHACEYDDWVLRMKEYERESRLLKRAAIKRERASSQQGGGVPA